MQSQWVATIALFVLAFVARYLAARSLRTSRLPTEVQRRWFVQIRTAAVLTLVFGLAVIWAAELRAAAFSLVAVAVALTIATKELILCLSGSLVRTTSRAFAVGDRVEVGEHRGDVIDIGALSTKILEVDGETNRRTGRVITIPNSMYLTTPMLNESFVVGYVLTVLTVPLGSGESFVDAEDDLLSAAQEEVASYFDEAKEQITRMSRLESLDAPIVEPTVSLVVESADVLKLVLRFPAPVRRSHRVEQAILRSYLSRREAKGPSEPSAEHDREREPNKGTEHEV